MNNAGCKNVGWLRRPFSRALLEKLGGGATIALPVFAGFVTFGVFVAQEYLTEVWVSRVIAFGLGVMLLIFYVGVRALNAAAHK